MFRIYPPRPLYYSPPVYSVYPDDGLYAPYLSYPHSRPVVSVSEARYRRAVGEYLAAAEEYNALLGAREAKFKAHAEAVRRERARLRLAQLARTRKQQQARQFEQGLAKALARAALSEDDDLSPHHVVPAKAMYRTSERPLSDMFVGVGAPSSCVDGARVEKEKAQHDEEERQPPVERSVPNLESLLRERLQKKTGDEEVQDVARAILRHLSSVTGVSCPSGAASSPEVNACSTEPSEGVDLYRSHALKGVAAEVAKASFKAHRAEVAERDEYSATSPTSRTASSSLSLIQDIRSALSKLSTGFSLPSSLDFTDDEPDGLAYTPTNAPVRVYEHALDELLAQLDAVETDGDEEVRMVRRAAVKEVEKAIEDVEKRIKEAKESAKSGSNPGMGVTAEADLTKGKNGHGTVDAETSVDKDKPDEGEPSSDPANRLDSGPASPEVVLAPNPEAALPHVTNPADSKAVLDDDIFKDQSSTRVLESISPVVPTATSSLASTDRVEVEVPGDDASESKHEALAEQVTADETTSTSSEFSPSITLLESPSGFSLPVPGAIAPSSTPVAPVLSSIIPEDLPASLSRHQVSVSVGDDDGLDDADDEGDWTEI